MLEVREKLVIATLAVLASAGIQIPLLVINMSPYPATIDFNADETCIKHDFDPEWLYHYYDAWESNNLDADFGQGYGGHDDHLQQFKKQLGVPRLRGHQAPMAATHEIPPFNISSDDQRVSRQSPYLVFEAEADASAFHCKDYDSWKTFSIVVNGKHESFTLKDPAGSQWTMDKIAPEYAQLTIGTGGSIDGVHLALDLVTLACTVATLGWALAARSVATGTRVWTAMRIATRLAPEVESEAYATAVRAGAAEYDVVASQMRMHDSAIEHLFKEGDAFLSQKYKTAYNYFLGFSLGSGLSGVTDWIWRVSSDAEQFGVNGTGNADDDDDDDVENEPLTYTAIYDMIGGERESCVLGRNMIGYYECMTAGAAIMIQGDGTAVAMPLPNVHRSWPE